jgi:hypothetical protein
MMWVLLILIGVLLLLLIVLLAAPLVYEFQAEKHTAVVSKFRLSWLFGIVRFRFVYENGHSETGLTALWFNLLGGKKAGEEEAHGDTDEKDSRAKALASKKKKLTEECEPSKDDETEEEQEELKDDDKRSFFEKIGDQYQSIEQAIGKIFSLIETIVLYPDKGLIARYTIDCVKALCRAVKIKKLDFSLEIGFDDPAVTAYAAGLIYAVKPFFMPQMILRVDCETPGIRGYLFSKGRSSFFALLYPLVIFALKKPIWGMIKKFMNRKS